MPAVTFDVKVTEITATVMLVIAGGVLLLVLAGFRMYTQRKRAAARPGRRSGSENVDERTAEGEDVPKAIRGRAEGTRARAAE